MRKENWTLLLSEYLKENLNKAFIYGERDCILFAAKGYYTLTGRNFYKQYQGYETEEQAIKIIELAGGIEPLVSRHIGKPHSNYLKAKRGDIVLMRSPEETLGIVDDSGHRIACLSKDGLVRLPIKSAKLIWSY